TEKGTHASCIANQKVKNISASSSSPQAPPSTPPQLLSELAAFEGISSIPIDDSQSMTIITANGRILRLKMIWSWSLCYGAMIF
ncbi:hypothetical protein GMDG_08794, partial [Pseudogymnoascus destructans 20631-21]